MTRIKGRSASVIMLSLLLGVSLAGLSLMLAHPPVAKAGTITVTSDGDDGTGTLRRAILIAAPGDTINFVPGLTTVNLTTAELLVNKNLTISGPGANLLTVQRSFFGHSVPNFRVFHIAGAQGNNVTVTLSGLTITNGNVPSGNGGGGIYNQYSNLTVTGCAVSFNASGGGGGIFHSTGTMNLINSTVSGNSLNGSSVAGGGITNGNGTVTITNSTISGNTATGSVAGGIFNIGGGPGFFADMTITNSTISGNSASTGGGIAQQGNAMNVRNTIIANNTATSGPDFLGRMDSQGFNLIGNTSGTIISGITTGNQLNQDPNLGPLADNGGATQTHALLPDSAAIDKGDSGGSTTDQRSFTRPVDFPNISNVSGGDGSDIGAFEVHSLTISPATLPAGMAGTFYSQALSSGGVGVITWGISAGALPAGITLNPASGLLSGTPTVFGSFNFTVRVTDSNLSLGERAYSLTIDPAGGGATNLKFYPLAHPIRLLDTRTGATGCDAPGAKIPGNTSRTQTAAGRTCDGLMIPVNAAALMGNVTTVQSGGGVLTLYASDITKPLAANSNYAANQILNNVFTVRLGAGDGAFKIYVSSDTDVVVDITGYYAPPAAGGLYFHPLPHPVRLLDTRAGQTACFTPGAAIQAGSTMTQLGQTTCDGVLIPAGAQALVGNATTTNQQANGVMTLYPANAAQPLAASSNFQAGISMNAPFMVGLSPSGQFNIFTASTTDLVIDVLGYYSTQMSDSNGQGLLFNSLSAPVRLLDTRASQSACFTPGTQMTGGVAFLQLATGACTNIPATAQAVVGNTTTVNVTANGFLTFWPSNANQSFIATSNYRTNQVFNRHFTVGLGPDGAFKRFAASTIDLIIDISGFFAP